jgi:ribosomal protein S12 methylthiotransferase accessory factor
MDYIVDDKVGLISTLEEIRPEAGAPNFFHFRAKACAVDAFSRETNFRDTGGAATHREVAMAKAIGEAIERYCPAIFEFSELPLFAWNNAPGAAVHPSEFALYLPEQYGQADFSWVPFEEDTLVRWTEARDLANGQAIWVPACRVFMPYNYYLGTGDNPIDQPISTGLACHGSYERAACVGLYEVVERDAVMITWQAMISPAAIRIETLPDSVYELVKRFELTGLRVDMFDITTDNGIPTILSTLRGQSSGTPALVVAASSSLLPEEAARKSLEELAHTRRYCQWVATNMPRLVPDPPNYDLVFDQVTHLNFYVDHANLRHAEFLFSSDQRKEFDAINNASSGDASLDLERITAAITATGERAFISNLTTPDVAELGLWVVRAMVPGYQPLHMGHRLRSRGGRRLYEVPQRLGHKGLVRGGIDNPAPHPYP